MEKANTNINDVIGLDKFKLRRCWHSYDLEKFLCSFLKTLKYISNWFKINSKHFTEPIFKDGIKKETSELVKRLDI